MTNFHHENNKRLVPNLIDDPEIANANAPGFSAGEFSDSLRSGILCQPANRSNDSVLEGLNYLGQLSLSAFLNEDLVFQSEMPSRISVTA